MVNFLFKSSPLGFSLPDNHYRIFINPCCLNLRFNFAKFNSSRAEDLQYFRFIPGAPIPTDKNAFICNETVKPLDITLPEGIIDFFVNSSYLLLDLLSPTFLLS